MVGGSLQERNRLNKRVTDARAGHLEVKRAHHVTMKDVARGNEGSVG